MQQKAILDETTFVRGWVTVVFRSHLCSFPRMSSDQEEAFPIVGSRQHGSKEPLRLFVVEDDEDLLEVLTTQCAQIHHVEIVGSADSASDAIERIIALRPDVALIDIQLRVGSGLDVLHRIRRHRPVLQLKLLAMSNARSEAVRSASLAAGADDFFDKLLEYEKLLKRISALAQQ